MAIDQSEQVKAAMREKHFLELGTQKSVKNSFSEFRYLMDRNLNETPKMVIASSGNEITLEDGQVILDCSGGAAVSCLGHGYREEVAKAMLSAMMVNSYANSMQYTSRSATDLAEMLIQGTNYMMGKAFLIGSGSEATEAAMKLAHQYFHEIGEPQRKNFIGRETSYHGNTLGALALSCHITRRDGFESLLATNYSWVSACNAYRQRCPQTQIDEEFVAIKAKELDAEFHRLGPSTVIAFVAETISGASLGCVPPVPGYLAAMKAVCRSHGALFILDEVMCGMGRTGTLHAWQADHSPTSDCIPDIQMVGKGLAAGFQPCSAVLAAPHIIEAIALGTGAFKHGHTFQAHPIAAAAGLAVQQIIEQEKLCANAASQGLHLAAQLHAALDGHPHVGNIRGRGLFYGIEFVRDKGSKKPFAPEVGIARRIKEVAERRRWSIGVYLGTGTADGVSGDHVIIAPAMNVKRGDLEEMVRRVVGVVGVVFDELAVEEGNAGEINGAANGKAVRGV